MNLLHQAVRQFRSQGLAIYRPPQTWNSQEDDQDLIAYPYTIEGTNLSRTYNITLVNTIDSIDFRQGVGHHLEGLFINALRRTIDLRADREPTVLENYIFKTEAWRTARFYTLPGLVSQNWADGCPKGNQDQGLSVLGFGTQAYGDGVFHFMGSYINATRDETYKFEGSPTVDMYVRGAEKERAGAPIFGLEILPNDTGNMDIELVGNSWNLNSPTSISTTNLGDRLNVFSGKNVGLAPIVYQMAGAGSFFLEISTDGGSSCTTIETWINDVDFVDDGSVYNNESIFISGFTLTYQKHIRFRCNTSDNNNDI